MKKKAVSILCMVAMSIGSLGTEVVCAAESDYALAKAPEDYKLTIYWPAPDTYFEENIQPGYQAVEEKYGVSFDYAIGKFVKDPRPIDNYFIIIAEILEIIVV